MRTLVLGVGCRAGTSVDEIGALARRVISEAGLCWTDIAIVATISHRLSEPGIVALAQRYQARLVGFAAGQLAAVPELPTPSELVRRHTGTPGIAEPAAILASGGGPLIVPKQSSTRATVAVAIAVRPAGSVD